MATYTMQLREVLTTYLELEGKDIESMNMKQVIEEGRKKLFNFDYPIFDPSYKNVLETHFIRKFYMREIGFETEDLFQFNLETWMIINMPYFNKLFESELLSFDPLKNHEIDVSDKRTSKRDQTNTSTTSGTSTGESNQTGSGTSSDDNFNRHLNSKNPDSRLAITTEDGQGVIEYASEINENTENNSRTSSSDVDTTSKDTTNVTNDQSVIVNDTLDYIQHRSGKTGDASYSKLLMEYRDSMIRIEGKMFDEMSKLFMLVY